MKAKKKYITFLVLVAALALVVVVFNKHIDQLDVLFDVSLGELAILIVIILAALVINGLKLHYIVRPFGISLQWREWFGISITNTFWNYLPFQGGLVARGLYLKHTHKLSYTSYIIMTVVSYIITLAAFGLCGAIVALILIGEQRIMGLVALFFVVLGVAPVVVLYVISKKRSSKYKRLQQLYDAVTDIHRLLKDRKLVIRLAVLEVLSVVMYAVRLVLAGLFLGFSLPFTYLLIVSPLGLLATLAAITPGGLVIREAVIGLVAGIFNMNVSENVIASLLDRGALMIVVLLLGIIFNFYLSRRALQTEPEKEI